MPRRFVFAAVAALVLMLAPAVQAESVRIPKQGIPAFAFEAPDGWRVVYDQYDNLQLFGQGCMLQLSVNADAAVETADLGDLAAAILKIGEFPPFTRRQPGMIAGRPGESFITSKVTNGVQLDVVLTLVKLDASHVASQVRMARGDVTPAATAALDALISKVRFTGVK